LFRSSPRLSPCREAAAIANQVLQGVLSQLAPGKDVSELCDFGDALIAQLTGQVHKTKKLEKGVAFPTCVSVNECVGQFSPLKSESRVLAEGDVVKVDLGVHIDGLIALAAHTIVLGASAERPVTGAHADVIAAAHAAAEVALRLIKPGNKNADVTAAVEKVAEAFGVRAVAGVQMLQLQQFVLEGPKRVALRGDKGEADAVKDCVFAADEAYAVDVCFSSGEGKPMEKDSRTTIFKRTVDNAYKPKIKASQRLLSEVNKRHPTLPFTLRSLGTEAETKLGVKELQTHGLIGAFPVLFEKEGAVVAQFRFTVLLLPGGTQKVTGLDLPAFVTSQRRLPAELEELRASVSYVAKAKKPKAVAGAAVAAPAAAVDAMKE
jgi:curved DNA binding protein